MLKILIWAYSLILNEINRNLYIFVNWKRRQRYFEINTVYLDLLSKVHYQSESLFLQIKSLKNTLLPLATFGKINYYTIKTILKLLKC